MILNVNAHLHTPYSFSAFRNIEEALDRAAAEKVAVVGINDFYSSAGYQEWKRGSEERGLYPLFGIEFISLNEDDQKAGLLVNDPANPGRTYLSGKGLRYPFTLREPYATQLINLQIEADRQVEKMFEKLNSYLRNIDIGFELDLQWIKEELTSGSLRERHLARALRMELFKYCDNNESEIEATLKVIFGGKAVKSSMRDTAGLENEIRASLLKAGGAAFVPEDSDAFLPMQAVYDIIFAAGGIPTYPFLADNANGEYTDFENDPKAAADMLTERGFHSVEFITTRNDVRLLENYAGYLYDRGFIVTFGSEHNSPVMEPIELFARNGVPLTERLKKINYDGACVIAAHQYAVSHQLEGYLDSDGFADRSKRDEFVKRGDELIKSLIV